MEKFTLTRKFSYLYRGEFLRLMIILGNAHIEVTYSTGEQGNIFVHIPLTARQETEKLCVSLLIDNPIFLDGVTNDEALIWK